MPLNDHLARAPRRGMIVRSREVLEPGQVLFKLGHRFDAHGRQSDQGVLSTPWWFSQGTAELISRSAAEAGGSLADAFRRFGAIAKRWKGSGDLIVRVELCEPLVAYIGPGTVQDFRGVKGQEAANAWDLPLWVPSAAIPQVHVSLMKKSDLGTSVAAEAFSAAHIVPIDKWDESYVMQAPKDKFAV